MITTIITAIKKNFKNIRSAWMLVLLIVAMTCMTGCSLDDVITVDEGTETVQENQENQESSYRFRNKKLLDQHYEKHGKDMGFASAQEYEAAAAKVVESKNALHKIEKEDGDDIYYIEETNEFVVVATDGYIRTYFLPDKGKAYYDKQ